MTLRTYPFTYSGTITIDEATLVDLAMKNTRVQHGSPEGQDDVRADLATLSTIGANPVPHLEVLVNSVFLYELAALVARFEEVLPGALVEHRGARIVPVAGDHD